MKLKTIVFLNFLLTGVSSSPLTALAIITNLTLSNSIDANTILEAIFIKGSLSSIKTNLFPSEEKKNLDTVLFNCEEILKHCLSPWCRPEIVKKIGEEMARMKWEEKQVQPSKRAKVTLERGPPSRQLSNLCLSSLLKDCLLIPECDFPSPHNSSGYNLVHQALYFILASFLKCETKHQEQFKMKVKGICSEILAEHEILSSLEVPLHFRDLYIEQGSVL